MPRRTAAGRIALSRSARAAARRVFYVSAITEALEPRRMLHNGVDHSVATVVNDDGTTVVVPLTPEQQLAAQIQAAQKGQDHISQTLYNSLSPDIQATISPHYVEDDRPVAEQLEPVFRSPATSALDDALPDMVPLVGNGYLEPYIDTTEQPGRNLLRFSTAVGNQGDGPVILTSSDSAINPNGTQIVTQQIYAKSGNSFVLNRSRVAGNFVWHPGHGHFHYEGYADYRLLTSVNGQPGPIAMRADGTPAVGEKVGFCLINISSSFTMPGTSTSSSTLANYGLAGQPSTSCGFVQGIHVGRADVYNSVYDGQWIDVTGVPNGQYFLEVTIDGSNTILEKNEANNTVYVPYTLNAGAAAGGIAPDRFEANGGNNAIATATNLGTEGFENQAGLTIHADYDEDFFKFIAASTGSGTVTTRATHGDVNVFLYDANGVLLKQSTIEKSGTATSPDVDTVTYSFVKDAVYYVKAAGFGSGTSTTSGLSNNYTLELKIKPSVSVSAPTVMISEGSTASFVITRNGPTSSPLTVVLSAVGTATSGVDYTALPTSVIIGVEADSVSVPFVTIKDNRREQPEYVMLTVSTTQSTYVSTVFTATITIIDNDPTIRDLPPTDGPTIIPSPLVFRGAPGAPPAAGATTTGLPPLIDLSDNSASGALFGSATQTRLGLPRAGVFADLRLDSDRLEQVEPILLR